MPPKILCSSRRLPALLLCLFASGSSLFADDERRFSVPDSETGIVLPISEDTVYGMLVNVRMEGRDLRLLLDTGASFSMLTEETTKRLGLVPQWNLDAIALSGRRVEIKAGLAKRVELGSIVIENELVGLNIVLPGGFPKSIDGILGLSSLQDFDVRINHRDRTLTLWAAGKSPRLEGERELPLTIQKHRGELRGKRATSCSVEAKIMGKAVPCIIDTGNVGGAMSMPEPLFASLFPELAKTASPSTFAGRDFSGEVGSREVRLPELQFAGETLKDFKIDLVPSRDAYGNLGQLVLNHFILTFDFQAGVLRSRSLGTLDELTQRSSAGLNLDLRDGDFFIGGLIPDGPAEKAGMKAGDKLLTVDGKEWKSLDDKSFYALVHLPPGTRIKVRYQRGAEAPAEVVLVLVKN